MYSRMLRALRGGVLDTVFPRTCPLCRYEHCGVTLYCASCLVMLMEYSIPLCFGCTQRGRVRTVHDCLVHRWDSILSLSVVGSFHHAQLRRLILFYKYSFFRVLSFDAAFLLIPIIGVVCDPSTVLIPVPLSPRRKRWRGYNQSELIARQLSLAFRVSMLCALTRVRQGRPSAQLSREERGRQTEGLYSCVPPHFFLKYSRVVLVDDVVTTGSTLWACAQALRNAGYLGEIHACALAIEW